jgi:hydroxylamine reductase
MFTCGIARLPGVTHIANRDFTPVIEKALALPEMTETTGPATMTGFHHKAVLGLADKIIGLIKEGKIRHFFVVGGCDGAKSGRNYYTEFVEKLPSDCVVLTLGCGKFRFNYTDFGDIDGVPRVLDMGQCNNAYSAIQVAAALADAFECGVNDLPLSLVLSWFEQKAVAILLSLLHLGIKNIRIGPSLPAFVTPNVLKVLQENYDLRAITTAEEDIKQILG